MGQRDALEQHGERPFSVEARSHFLNELRQARLAAQKDAEAFDQLLFAFERLGSYLLHKVGALGDYEASLMNLASTAALGQDLNSRLSPWHSDKHVLYKLVKDARNDAFHQGATARHLTQHALEKRPQDPTSPIAQEPFEKLFLVCSEEKRLLGIVTPFDLL
jgi:hypothetical protein